MKRREFICTEKNPDSSHSNYTEEHRWLDRRILFSVEWSPMLLLRRMEVVELETRGVVDEKTSGNNKSTEEKNSEIFSRKFICTCQC